MLTALGAAAFALLCWLFRLKVRAAERALRDGRYLLSFVSDKRKTPGSFPPGALSGSKGPT
jgi:hypothetical protein